MAIATLAQRNALVTAYIAAAPYGALFGSDPGTSGTATGEISGGSPAYTRKALNWSAVASSASSGTGNFDVASGVTVAYAGVTVSSTPTTADVRDRAAVTSQPFSSQGTYALGTTFTQT